MESITKKMKSSKGINGFEDRLSGLPDHLIVHILSFLPTLDAVKTMLLCRFGNLWTLVHALEFNLEEYDKVICPGNDKLTSFEVFSSFSRVVRNVLMLHRSPTIDRFDLVLAPFEFRFENLKDIQDIQMWLRFAIDKQVKDLNFVFDGFDDILLPRCVATSQSLTNLELTGCVLEDQPRVVVHMKSLQKLLLRYVRGSNEAFDHLIAGCPSLQELIIDTIDEMNVLKVTSPIVSKLDLTIQGPEYDSFTLSCPNVKTLDIFVSSNRESFTVNATDVSSLQVVNANCLFFLYSFPVEAILRQFQNVEVFTLSSNAYLNLCQVNIFDVPVTRWKRIVLRPYWEARNCLQLIPRLVKSSTELEELIIYNEFESPRDEGEYIIPELSATSAMPLLKSVTIHSGGGFTKVQLQLVELLLGNAVVLEKLVITFDRNRPQTVEELNFVKQVSKFSRASVNATVIFA